MNLAPSHRRAFLVAFALCAPIYAWLVARFAWLCDDSFISFRYARNLAEGRGLTYNASEVPPLEGFTNLLWVLWLAPFEALGVDITLVAQISTIACGIAALICTGLFAASRASTPRGAFLASLAALAFLATLPPFATWTTSGLETMPFTLALLALFASTFAARPRVACAIASAIGVLLLRADGFVFAGIVVALGLVLGRGEARATSRAALRVALVAAAVFALHMLWRRWYFGAWAPNTARVKVELGLASAMTGARYVGTFLVTYPAVLIALAVAAWAALRSRDRTAIAALFASVAITGYAIAVGGDFMAMGRFLVPALPLVAIAFAHALERASSTTFLSAAPIAACTVLSLVAAFDVHVAPLAIRRPLRFRWNSDDWMSEYGQWDMMRRQSQRWTLLGRALAEHSQPGDSIVIGTIGAVGYYSRLEILDPFGLVSREEFAPLSPDELRSPGHQRRIPLATFLARRPTFLEAQMVPRDEPFAGLRRDIAPGGPYAHVTAPEWIDLAGTPGVPPDYWLRLVRYRAPE